MSKKAIVYFIPAPAVAYVGPGDVVASAAGWWGLRAYTSSGAGGNCIDIIRASDSATQTFTTLANGSLDLASIITFLSSTTGKVSKLYDQSGNGRDMSQGSDPARPTFTFNAIGSLPCMTFGGSQSLTTASILWNISDPYTISAIGNRTGSTTSFSDFVGGGATVTPQLGASNAVNTGLMYANNVASITGFNDNAFHAVQGLFNGSSSDFYFDGGSNVCNAGSANMGVQVLTLGTGNNNLTGKLTEAGIWATGFSSSNKSNMNSNQHTYWGF